MTINRLLTNYKKNTRVLFKKNLVNILLVRKWNIRCFYHFSPFYFRNLYFGIFKKQKKHEKPAKFHHSSKNDSIIEKKHKHTHTHIYMGRKTNLIWISLEHSFHIFILLSFTGHFFNSFTVRVNFQQQNRTTFIGSF